MKRVLLAASCMLLVSPALADTGWSQYGGDQGGQRHSGASQITPSNVTGLRQAWSYSTGALTRHAGSVSKSAFENTPILNEGKLFVCSSFQEVSALDPGTGKEIWRFDPHVSDDAKINYPNSFNVYDSMGDLLVARAEKDSATKCYQKALLLRENPDTRKKLEGLSR